MDWIPFEGNKMGSSRHSTHRTRLERSENLLKVRGVDLISSAPAFLSPTAPYCLCIVDIAFDAWKRQMKQPVFLSQLFYVA